MASQTEENYLKSLFLLANASGEINLSDLSKSLDISIPTANSMVNKLHEKGLVKYVKYKPLTLTAKGKKEAALIIRKHRLTEMFLVEVMGFGWELVHDIAEQIEHINSELFFDRMDELLSYPTVDPHGSPIPDKKGRIAWKSYDKLSNCKEGQAVKLVALTQSSEDFLKFLNAKNIFLGLEVKVLAIESYDQSMTISYGKYKEVQLSHLVCDKLLVDG
jgi:DtxR family transcriptional regulator, Mn-dependent transcriptional regulator